jgi:hypothetical protein
MSIKDTERVAGQILAIHRAEFGRLSDIVAAKDAEIAALRTACVEAQGAVQAFWDMVRIMRKFQTLPIPSIIETADHNCPIILGKLSAALGEEKSKS